jgi:hypothetical protein
LGSPNLFEHPSSIRTFDLCNYAHPGILRIFKEEPASLVEVLPLKSRRAAKRTRKRPWARRGEAKLRTAYEMEELKALRGANSFDVVSLESGGVLRMMDSHLPFKNEYLGFVAHLRGLAGSPSDSRGSQVC